MNRLTQFVRGYKFFAAALVIAVVGLLFDIIGSKVSGFRTAAHVILGAESIFMALVLARGMYHDVRAGTYGVDILAVAAIVTSVLLKEYWTAMITVLMLTGGEALEDYAENRAKSELTALLERAPKKAKTVNKNGTINEVPIANVRIGDIVLIAPGELVPVDCVVTEGSSSFDESSLTGESLPVARDMGGELLSGSVNLEGVVHARAIRAAKDSQFEQIIQIVKNAANSESPFVRLADRYSVPFTILAFAIAIGVWVYSGDSGRFLRVLVVATPCPLLLGAPIGLISGMSRAAKHGIIIKNGSSLEKLANIKTIAFDKTGTLTIGKPSVDQIVAVKGFSKNDLLACAASLEQNSTHILAKAIVGAAETAGLELSKVKGQQEISGRGIVATVKKRAVAVGRLVFLEERGITLPKTIHDTNHSAMTTYLAIDGEYAGYITFIDELRPESQSMLNQLKKLGLKHIFMLTGDNENVAKKIASKLGLSEYKANCLPGDKVKAISDISDKNRPVAFVGDGVNDAPVLTTADVGIALGARGSAAASESADVVVLLDDVSKVSEAVDIAKRTFKITKQSILLGIGMSIVLMVVFATGRFEPVYGAAIQELVDVAVILSALRAHGPFGVKKLVKKI